MSESATAIVIAVIAVLATPLGVLVGWLLNGKKNKAEISQTIAAASEKAVGTMSTVMSTVTDELKEQIDVLRGENAELQAQVDALKEENSKLTQVVEDMRAENAAMRKENAELRQQISTLTLQIKKLTPGE